MELAPPVSGVVFFYIFWTIIVLYYYYFFVYSVIALFYSFSLSYTRLVVRTWRDLAPLICLIYFWGVTIMIIILLLLLSSSLLVS
jgi:hypothetical protein